MTNIIPLSLKPGWYILMKNGEPGLRTWQPFTTEQDARDYLSRNAASFNVAWLDSMEVVEVKG